jgi:hypothetical protein
MMILMDNIDDIDGSDDDGIDDNDCDEDDSSDNYDDDYDDSSDDHDDDDSTYLSIHLLRFHLGYYEDC